MSKRTEKEQYLWGDKEFVKELREIKRAKNYLDKPQKDYSDAEISKMIVRHPLFQELKKQMINQNQELDIKIRLQMDSKRKRGGW